MPADSASLTQLVLELDRLRDPQQRLAVLIDWARHQPGLASPYRTESNRVAACQVRTWWVAEVRNDGAWFGLDSDGVSLKALGGFLCEQASGLSRESLAQFDAAALERWGVLRLIAENRRATVLRIADQIREFDSQIRRNGVRA